MRRGHVLAVGMPAALPRCVSGRKYDYREGLEAYIVDEKGHNATLEHRLLKLASLCESPASKEA